MMTIRRVTLRRLRLPLMAPYRLSYRTFREFEPYLVELEASDGRTAFGDGHVSPGSSSETREGAWRFLSRHLKRWPGQELQSAKSGVLAEFEQSKVAATACVTAAEMLEGNALLCIDDDLTLPLLTPVGGLEQNEIVEEVEQALQAGFRTLKIKVGRDVRADLARVGLIQDVAAGRAQLRIDANRAYSREEALAFATSIDPTDIELFEQPCDAEDWSANAAVARRSVVPLMLDEPICSLADINRAADIPGVEFCKVKLKRFGGLDRLIESINYIIECGMTPVLGDGLGSEIHSWMEACVAAHCIDNAGEFNGFLKPTKRVFENPLPFGHGAIMLTKQYRPRLDRELLEQATIECVSF